MPERLSWKDEITTRLADLKLPPAREAEIVEELAQHLDDRYQELLSAGSTESKASVAVWEELDRDALLSRLLEKVEHPVRHDPVIPGTRERRNVVADLWLDLRYGVRMLAKARGFAVVAVLTLALGIGANTAIFSVVNGVLLNPLPYPDPEQLVTLDESKPNFETGSISYPNFLDWQKNNHTFTSMAISRNYSYNMTGLGDAERVRAALITSDFFRLLGVQAMIGRTFAPGEDRVGAAPIALITASFWKRKLGSARDVLGRVLTLDGRSYTIVGVIPPDFDLLLRNLGTPEVYVPVGQWDNNFLLKRMAGLGFHGVGRLKRGMTVDQAQTDMNRVTGNLAAAYPDDDKGIGATVRPLRQYVVGHVQSLLLILLASVGFVLLIACVNVANLLLARATGRTREFAVRLALGAAPARIIRQLLTESVLLALAGGGLGLTVAAWGTQAALAALPASLPRASEIRLDARVLLFTLAISVLAGALFGLAPAFKALRTSLHDTLKEGGRGASGANHRAHGVLVVAEMALALVLLIGAGLMVRTLALLWRVNPGFDSHHVLTFGVSLSPSMRTASPAAIRTALRNVTETLEATPGIQAASLSWGASPLSGDDEDLFWIEGEPKPATENDMHWALSYVVQEDYLKVMGIPLERGRFFTAQDNESAPHVILIDDVFAQRYFPGQNPIGKHVYIDVKGGVAEIVGIVGHVKQWGLDSDDTQSLRAQLYFPYMQLPDAAMQLSWSGTGGLVRFNGPAPAITDSIRAAFKRVNNEQVLFGVETMDEVIADSLATRRFSMALLGSFAAVALLLASVGIYGVISFLAGQRTHEIGVRIALGAKSRDVLRLVMRQGAKMALLGVGLGLVAAAGLTRLMTKYSMLFGVSAIDPLTFASVAILLTVVALAACYLPARRAMRVDPVVALRYE